jgi:hypothetical protein
MSAKEKRQVSCYPRPILYKKLLELANKQNRSISSILVEALDGYFKATTKLS